MHVHVAVTSCVVIQIEWIICQNDRGDMLYTLFHCAMLVWVHLDALISVARVLLVILLPCLRYDNLVHVYPNDAYDMSKCSLWSVLHDGCCSMLVWVHIAMLISLAKVHLAVKCWNLLWDVDFICSLLLMCLSSCHMSRCFRSTIIWSLLWCNPISMICLEVT